MVEAQALQGHQLARCLWHLGEPVPGQVWGKQVLGELWRGPAWMDRRTLNFSRARCPALYLPNRPEDSGL